VRARMHRRRLASGLAACGLVLSTIGLVGPRVAASGPFEAPEPAVVMRPFAVEVVPADLGWARVASTFGASGATAPSEDYVLVASASGVAAVKKVLLSRRVGADGRLRCVSIPRAAPAHEVGGRASGLIGHAGAAAQ